MLISQLINFTAFY